MPEIRLEQGTVRYREQGPADGPPVLFAHGFLVDGSLWDEVADALAARGYRTLQPDLPLGAHKLALNPDADLSPRGVARLIVGFATALELEDVTLVGNDSGGALCQFVLDTDASRIGRVVLTNCDGIEVFPPKPFDILLKLACRPRLFHAVMQGMRLTALRHGPLGFGLLVQRPLAAQQSRGWVMPYLTDAGVRRDAAAFCRGIDPAELSGIATRLRRFPGQVLLCWAPRDRFFTIELGRRLEACFADARLVEIPDARTFVPHDQPLRLADEVAAFAARVPA
ncbi:alpha/beta fold hydrolase [Conexibacter sp. CPCC 206217]|uniref:alpha/beta fold hydrolase n=1 Tax=Conexibacter sp. CPCC 206217 TaxID=3064574 RepID=UPI00271DA8B1|nr:alpha/beta hydrolase [Conexibacter sp. CPCC 206217]MDO8213794.1 alpha/beta hydrolase [Conexibacter sp. CPCC 206217]